MNLFFFLRTDEEAILFAHFSSLKSAIGDTQAGL